MNKRLRTRSKEENPTVGRAPTSETHNVCLKVALLAGVGFSDQRMKAVLVEAAAPSPSAQIVAITIVLTVSSNCCAKIVDASVGVTSWIALVG